MSAPRQVPVTELLVFVMPEFELKNSGTKLWSTKGFNSRCGMGVIIRCGMGVIIIIILIIITILHSKWYDS